MVARLPGTGAGSQSARWDRAPPPPPTWSPCVLRLGGEQLNLSGPQLPIREMGQGRSSWEYPNEVKTVPGFFVSPSGL